MTKQKEVFEAWGHAHGIVRALEAMQQGLSGEAVPRFSRRPCPRNDRHKAGKRCPECSRDDGKPWSVMHELDWYREELQLLLTHVRDLDPLLHRSRVGDIIAPPSDRPWLSVGGMRCRSAHEAALSLGTQLVHVLRGEPPTRHWLNIGGTHGEPVRLPEDWDRERSWTRLRDGFVAATCVAMDDRDFWHELRGRLENERRDAEQKVPATDPSTATSAPEHRVDACVAVLTGGPTRKDVACRVLQRLLNSGRESPDELALHCCKSKNRELVYRWRNLLVAMDCIEVEPGSGKWMLTQAPRPGVAVAERLQATE